MRLFVATRLSQETLLALERAQARLSAKMGRGLSFPPAQSLHLTLAFLGEVDAGKLDLLEAALARTAKEVSKFNYQIESLGMFPENGSPRVVWAGVSNGFAELKYLMQIINSYLRAAEFRIEERDPHPHVTLARVKDRRVAAQVRGLVSKIALDVTKSECLEFTLFNSELTAHGAVHRQIQTFALVDSSPDRSGTAP